MSNKLKSKSVVFALICLLTVSFYSCKVNYGFKGITIPLGAKTISVAMFQNQANLTAPVEPQLLTQKLRDAVSSQTNLGLLKNGGDLLFEECRITNYNTAPQSIAATTDQAALNRLTVTIKLNFVNKLDETKNFTDREFTRYFDYPAAQNLSQIESAALEQINRQLTEDIFNAAFNNW
ncbi:MAG TPA: LptE family protein [Bacteroidia bacterium]|nr:LptE family protein [Bacteroidia bacterium]